jgi:hypothetical protein
VVKHLHCVPRTLTEAHRVQPAIIPNEGLHELRFIRRRGWQYIIPVDESWFDFDLDHEQIWFRPEQESAERWRHTIEDKKMIVTIASNSLRFHLGKCPPNRKTLNAEHYRDNMVAILIFFCSETMQGRI